MSESIWKPAILSSKLLQRPRGLRVFEGRLYIADRSARVCYETSADLSDEELKVIPASEVKIMDYFREPYFIFPGLNGDIYTTEHLNGCIFVLSGSEPRVRAGKPGYGHGGSTTDRARFMNPRGGVVDPETGILWIADHANDQLRCIEPNEIVSSIGNGPSKTEDGHFDNCCFRRPSDICYHQDGIFFVAEAYTIRRVDRKNRTVTTLTGTPNEGGSKDGPPGIASLGVLWSITIAGDHLFVTDVDTRKIRVIDMFGHVSTLEMPSTPELFGIAVTPHGHVLYTSQSSSQIEMIPFVLDELQVQPITMELLLDFDNLPYHDILGEKMPLPILQLAYPHLLSSSDDSYNSLKSITGATKMLIRYLLTNDEKQIVASEYSEAILETLRKLEIPLVKRDSQYRPSMSFLQRCLSALYRQVVIKDLSEPKEGQIKLEEKVLAPLECNFTLVSSSGVELPCHDWVLYARWPFFRHLCKTGMIEISSKRAELDELKSDTLKSLIGFFYTNDLEEFRDPVLAIDLLEHAQRFNLADMSSPPQPTETAFKQLLARCRRAFDTLPNSLLPNVLSVVSDYATPSQKQRINNIIAK